MDIYIADIDHATSAYRDPGGLDPLTGDVSIDKDVQMRIPVLVKFENPDVLDRGSILATQVNAQHRKKPTQVLDGVTLDLRRIERQGEQSLQRERLCRLANSTLVALSSSGTAVGAIPGLTIDPMEARFRRIRSPPPNRISAAMLAPP